MRDNEREREREEERERLGRSLELEIETENGQEKDSREESHRMMVENSFGGAREVLDIIHSDIWRLDEVERKEKMLPAPEKASIGGCRARFSDIRHTYTSAAWLVRATSCTQCPPGEQSAGGT